MKGDRKRFALSAGPKWLLARLNGATGQWIDNEMILATLDVWVGKTLFVPLIVKLCQITGQSQFAISRLFWFVVALDQLRIAQTLTGQPEPWLLPRSALVRRRPAAIVRSCYR